MCFNNMSARICIICSFYRDFEIFSSQTWSLGGRGQQVNLCRPRGGTRGDAHQVHIIFDDPDQQGPQSQYSLHWGAGHKV